MKSLFLVPLILVGLVVVMIVANWWLNPKGNAWRGW